MAKKGKKPATVEPEILNRRARHDFEILDTLETGIALRGSEIKSVRMGRISISEGFVRAELSPLRLTLHAVHVDEYGPAAGMYQHDRTRSRRLLAHKREIRKMAIATTAKGVTIVPLKLYFVRGYAKLLIGLARGKKQYDKRQDIRDRDAKRDMDRAAFRRR